jgi:hypothetical protein
VGIWPIALENRIFVGFVEKLFGFGYDISAPDEKGMILLIDTHAMECFLMTVWTFSSNEEMQLFYFT